MSDEQFYFNPATGEVTEGKVGGWDERMGPYATREEAQAALQIAASRNKDADAKEEADENWGKPASWEK
ncbi:SPOR domain-containing protein [Corynebacterium senegalense]|uniref:SPOR domain-containing protein n=1 Tax=Corynebacterium senegalense TaxID=2080750 RepID=UPI000E20BD4D